jgi:hypothetical protein
LKRSRQVKVTIVGALGVTLGPLVAACGSGDKPPTYSLHCVDSQNVVVEERLCPPEGTTEGGGGSSDGSYHWWYGAPGVGYYALGTALGSVGGGGRTAAPDASYRTQSGTTTLRGGLGGSSKPSISGSKGGGSVGTGGGISGGS